MELQLLSFVKIAAILIDILHGHFARLASHLAIYPHLLLFAASVAAPVRKFKAKIILVEFIDIL